MNENFFSILEKKNEISCLILHNFDKRSKSCKTVLVSWKSDKLSLSLYFLVPKICIFSNLFRLLPAVIDFFERAFHTSGLVSCQTPHVVQQNRFSKPWLHFRKLELHNLTALSF